MSNLVNVNENIFEDSFPGVFGKNAEYNFINFFYQLKDSDFPKEKIKNYYYFQIGRWDLVIEWTNNKTSNKSNNSLDISNRHELPQVDWEQNSLSKFKFIINIYFLICSESLDA